MFISTENIYNPQVYSSYRLILCIIMTEIMYDAVEVETRSVRLWHMQRPGDEKDSLLQFTLGAATSTS